NALGRVSRSAYSATKAALIGLTRTWALEFAAAGITVNAVSPGAIETSMLDQTNPEGSADRESLRRSTPVGRLGDPQDVANCVSFFMDCRSSFVTGQVLYVCGGRSVGCAPW